ncbi:adenylate kinase-domain-containing protein [Coemansia spiralis]|nr:adenylate kinase-domain-containing protein [Coemansia spiralis]
MFNALCKPTAIRSAQPARAAILHSGKPNQQAWSRQYSQKKNIPDLSKLGQSKGGKQKGKGYIFGFHPIAILGSLTVIGCGFTMIGSPYLEWNKKQKEKREQQEKNTAKEAFSKEDIEKFPFGEKTVVFVLGGPGSGKGTNSAKLVEDFGFVHLSAGDLLRAEQKREVSQYGELISHHIREGIIVPPEITIGLLRNAMMEHPEANRFLIDGFPRSLAQAKAFKDTVCNAKQVLYFECPEAVMLERLLDRGKTSGRTDDNIESIKKRFRTYVNDSKPVIDDFAKQGKVITVSCKGSVDDVYKTTKQQMAKFLKSSETEKKA